MIPNKQEMVKGIEKKFAQGGLRMMMMESVVMIVNSIVGVQSYNNTSGTSTKRRRRKVCGSCLVGMGKKSHASGNT